MFFLTRKLLAFIVIVMLEGLDLKNLLEGVRARASIIFYLNKMVDEGVLGFRDTRGKGGHHRIYITKLDESGYKKYIVRTLLDSVAKDYPKETKEVLQAF